MVYLDCSGCVCVCVGGGGGGGGGGVGGDLASKGEEA